MKIQFLLSLIVIFLACSNSKPSTVAEEVKDHVSQEYVYTLINTLATQNFVEPVNVKFSSSIPSDTLYPSAIDAFSEVKSSNYYVIDVEKRFRNKLKDFTNAQFLNIDSTSSTIILVALTGLDIREGDHDPYEPANESSLLGITTMATSFMVVEIYQNEVKTFSKMFINEGIVSNERDNFRDSHIASIEAANESAILKLIGLFNGCDKISCVTLNDPITTADGLEDIPIISYSAEGNLESFEPINECVEISELKNTNTPADILPLSRRCMDNEEYVKAIRLSGLARLYAFFDMKRVSDGSAHQAILMLEEGAFQTLSRGQLKELETAWEPFSSENAPESISLCRDAIKLGKPNYHPTYMIQHGLGAFINDGGNGLVENFKPDSAWTEVLTQFGCLEE